VCSCMSVNIPTLGGVVLGLEKLVYHELLFV